MFERFLAAFGPADWHVTRKRSNQPAEGAARIRAELGGAVFADGLYRIVPDSLAEDLSSAALESDVGLPASFSCFGADWRGSLYGSDADGTIYSVELAFCEAFPIPATVDTFHDGALVDLRAPALGEPDYREWQRRHGGRCLGMDRCAGFGKPPFLGGGHEIEDMEETDLSVYVHITLQVFQRVKHLPPGTPVGPFRIE